MFITPPFYNDPVERLAFNAYAMHTSELDEIVNKMVSAYNLTGDTIFNVDGYLSPEDEAYIRSEFRRRVYE